MMHYLLFTSSTLLSSTKQASQLQQYSFLYPSTFLSVTFTADALFSLQQFFYITTLHDYKNSILWFSLPLLFPTNRIVLKSNCVCITTPMYLDKITTHT